MNIQEAMQARHSVRSFTKEPLRPAHADILRAEMEACNRESGLHIQLMQNEPRAFAGLLAYYGRFRNVRNYLVMAGPKGDKLDETVGYYGQRLVLFCQQQGISTCWVAASYRKSSCPCQVVKGETLRCVIALGYAEKQGKPHRSKPLEKLYTADETPPAWFIRGMDAAALAPTAINQQKFMFTLAKGKVTAKATGGVYPLIDLGIVKYQFEQGAGVKPESD